MGPHAFISKLFGEHHSPLVKNDTEPDPEVAHSHIHILSKSLKPCWVTSESEVSVNEMNGDTFCFKIPRFRGADCGEEIKGYGPEIFPMLCQWAWDCYVGGVSGHERDNTGSSTNIVA